MDTSELITLVCFFVVMFGLSYYFTRPPKDDDDDFYLT